MTISLSTPVMSAGIGKPASVVAYAQRNGAMRLGEVKTYADTIYDLAPKVGLNPDILIAQSDEETDHWRSSWWVDRLNPAGIGITGDPAQNAASGEWNSGADAAKAQIIHMLAYTRGSIPAIAEPWLKFDPRYQEVFLAGLSNSVSIVDDLGGGTWADDPDYAKKIVQHHEAIFAGEPPMAETITYGRVPYPTVVPSHLSTSNPYIKSGAPDIPDAVFWHRMIGSWAGTNSWFHGGNAATAYGVSVKATDGVGGKIYEWIKPGSGLYGESSGPAVNPYGDGQKLIDKVGVANVNRVSKAIEISGNYDTPLDEDAIESIVAITAFWADRKKIPYNEFPIVPNEDRSFVIWHQEITGPDYKECPGSVVIAATSAMIDRVAVRLKQFQVSTTTTTTPAPKPPSIYPKGMTLQLAKRLYGSLSVSWAAKPFTFDPSRSECKAWLDRGKASMTGDTYDTGTWPSIADAIRRGDGSRVYTYSDGSTHEQ